MLVQDIAIDKVIPYENNPREITVDAIRAVETSLKEYGWQQPIVVDENMVVVVGHTRLLAAKNLGMTEVPCQIAKGLTPEQLKAYRVVDNKSGEKALWSYEKLQKELLEFDLSEDIWKFNFNKLELDTIMQADWNPKPPKDEPEQPEETSSDIQPRTFMMTEDQHKVVREALDHLISLSEGAALEQICLEWMGE